MSTLNRYLLEQITKPMIVTIVVALLALLAERTLRVVDLVVGWQGSLLIVIEMLGYLIPHYLGLALPVAFFLAILIVFGRLSREGEVDAMMSAGAGLPWLVRPLILASILLALIEALLVSHLQPYSRYAYRAATHAVTSASFHRLLQAGVFTSLGPTTYMAENLSRDKSELRSIFLYSNRADGESVVVTAERGMVEPPSGNVPLILHLENGVNQILPGSSGGEDLSEMTDQTSLPAAITLRFGRFETDLSGSQPQPFRPRGEDEREYTLPELAGYLGQPPEHVRAAEIDAEFHGRLVRILALPVLPFLALPLAIERRRSQRYSGLVVGLAILIGFNQVIQFGESMVDDGQSSPWIGLWLPFSGLLTVAAAFFLRTAYRVPDATEPWLDRMVDRVRSAARQCLGASVPGN